MKTYSRRTMATKILCELLRTNAYQFHSDTKLVETAVDMTEAICEKTDINDI